MKLPQSESSPSETAPLKASGPGYFAKLHLFRGLDEAQLKQVAALARTRRIEKDAFIFQEQDPAGHVYVLTHGKARLSQLTPDGQQVIMRYASPVEEFGLIALLTGVNYPVTAQAVEDCELLSWDKPALGSLMAVCPKIAINAVEILAERVQEFQDRVREMATERVERRIARTLLRLARQAGRKTQEGVLIDLPLSRQDLAEMNGTTLYTVSRVLSQWEIQGLVQSGRERVVIRFPHGLVRIAEDLARPTSEE